MTSLLSISNLAVSRDSKPILQGISLEVKTGELHVFMGPNGSGKSSFAYSLLGHPAYEMTAGSMLFKGQDLTQLSPDKRARLGLFLAFQYPHEIEGVKLYDFLRQSYNALYAGTDKQLSPKQFRAHVESKLELLKMDPVFISRSVNHNFSGGEKKRAEMLQLAVLEPQLAILDEIDSGLDIDALRIVCEAINSIKAANPSLSLIIITHYHRILNYIHPNYVHVVQTGIISKSGTAELALEIEHKGYTL